MLRKAIVLGLTVASLSSYSTPTHAQDYMQQRDTLMNQGYQNMYSQTYDPAGRRWNPNASQAGQGQTQLTPQEIQERQKLCDCSQFPGGNNNRICQQKRQMLGYCN